MTGDAPLGNVASVQRQGHRRRRGKVTDILTIDFSFRELEIFCRVVELESFSRAADAVFLAQASVSERIASLEKKVGLQLLDRLGRKVVPTAGGELLYKHATLLLDMKAAARAEMAGFLNLEQGEVSVGGSTIPGEYILPRLIGGFNRRHPRLMVKLIIADSGEIERRVVEGELEIGVIGAGSDHASLICHRLWRDELVVAVPARHPLAKRREIPFEALRKTPFILREEGSGTLKILDAHLREAGYSGVDTLNVSARFGSSTAIKEGVKAGLGISVLSARALATEVEAGLLHAARIIGEDNKGMPIHRHFFLIRNKTRIASPPCRVMFDYLLSAESD